MNLFAGSFKTTDGKKWGVAFRAHSWSDARAIAEQFQATVDGLVVRTLRKDEFEELPSVSHLAGWEFIDNQFKRPDRV